MWCGLTGEITNSLRNLSTRKVADPGVAVEGLSSGTNLKDVLEDWLDS